jgi:hypothetical protein
MKKTFLGSAILLMVIGLTGFADAVVVDFTGGTVYLGDGGGTATTNNLGLWNNRVDYYEENGFKYDFIGGLGTVGDYYSLDAGRVVGNDVIHAHWTQLS